MLKSWSIENFKPIINSGELKLAPITVLAGRNSSGKSSVLQSILMIAQTLSSKVVDRALLPTGLNVQLGTFEDILNVNSSSRTLTIGFHLEFEAEPASTLIGNNRALENASNVTSIKTIATFNSGSDSSTISSAIEAAKVIVEKVSMHINAENVFLVEVENENDPTLVGFQQEISESNFSFIIDKLSDDQLSQYLEKVEVDSLRFVPYSGEQSNYIGNFEHQDETTKEAALVSLSHFLPVRLVHKFRVEERRLRSLRRQLLHLTSRATSDTYFKELIQRYSDLFDPEAPISEETKIAVQKICEDVHLVENFTGQTILDLTVWANSLKRISLRSGREIAAIKKILLQVFHNAATELEGHKNTEGLETLVNDNDAENINQAVTKITRFFTSEIRYLGPLRADPQASQKFSPSSELDDVGAKGEYAAAVYDANQNANIEWYNPITQQIEQGTLKVALDQWVRYLDVANQIKIETAGQSGFSWQVVHKKGQKPLPLSAVGVGVSQILPILVMGLLAPKNTLLMVEQPELHLHPNVQALLGDFFVGLSKCEKQCLIETHSENLVSQLRYHIVQVGSMENSNCIIYFVDQDNKGTAKFDPVQISSQGNILNWPNGFFDETMLQEDRITAASIKKRANKARNG